MFLLVNETSEVPPTYSGINKQHLNGSSESVLGLGKTFQSSNTIFYWYEEQGGRKTSYLSHGIFPLLQELKNYEKRTKLM